MSFKLPNLSFCTIKITQHALQYDWYHPARLLILAKKQPKYLEVTKFQSIFAKE